MGSGSGRRFTFDDVDQVIDQPAAILLFVDEKDLIAFELPDRAGASISEDAGIPRAGQRRHLPRSFRPGNWRAGQLTLQQRAYLLRRILGGVRDVRSELGNGMVRHVAEAAGVL